MIVYKIDVLEKLKEKGYSQYVLRKENLLPQSTITRLRDEVIVSSTSLDVICKLLECQPGDILEYKELKKNT